MSAPPSKTPPRFVPTLTDVVAVAAGSRCIALKSDGTIVTWGSSRDWA